MKTTILLFTILLIITSCASNDRDHLVFKDSIDQVEMHLRVIDSILPYLPPQKRQDKIQSFFYETENGDTILYVNSILVGSVLNASTEKSIDSIFKDKRKAIQFLKSSKFLARNNLTHCLNGYCGWVYVYKYSNDRGAYRPVTYGHNNRKLEMIDSCEFSLIDKKGNILLFKERNTYS